MPLVPPEEPSFARAPRCGHADNRDGGEAHRPEQGPQGRTGAAGPQGATGIQGATGQQGPPGTARDAGDVQPAFPSPVFSPQGLVGWVSVTNIGTGDYCLTPDKTSTAANTSLLVSTGGPGPAVLGIAVWAGYCSNPFALQVETFTLSGSPSNAIPFEAVIP